MSLEGGEHPVCALMLPHSLRGRPGFPSAGADFRKHPDLGRGFREHPSLPRVVCSAGAQGLASSAPEAHLCPLFLLLKLTQNLHDYSNPDPWLRALPQRGHALYPLHMARCPVSCTVGSGRGPATPETDPLCLHPVILWHYESLVTWSSAPGTQDGAMSVPTLNGAWG